MVYIRADANEVIGTGHVMRCLSIAKELRRKSEDVIFLIADERTEQIITEFGFQTVCLHSQWNDMESELETILQLLGNAHAKTLLVDSYYVTQDYLKELRRHVRLVYIDDLNAFLYPVDMLINYNVYAEKMDYKNCYQMAGLNTEFFLGCEYVPLRTEFRNVCRKKCSVQNGQVGGGVDNLRNFGPKKILITSGGTDNRNVAGRLLNKLREQDWFEKTEYYVILGRFHPYESVLKEQWSGYGNVFLYKNVSNISQYMTMCDAAVTAGGSTVYELCACGLPAIIYTLADNQFEIARAFDALGLMPWCGDIREDICSCIEYIIKRLEMMLFKEEMLTAKGMELQLLVDGYGAERIAEKLVLLS